MQKKINDKLPFSAKESAHYNDSSCFTEEVSSLMFLVIFLDKSGMIFDGWRDEAGNQT
jgi:hypothetical protein